MEAVINMARGKKGGLERLAKEKGGEIKRLVQVIRSDQIRSDQTVCIGG